MISLVSGNGLVLSLFSRFIHRIDDGIVAPSPEEGDTNLDILIFGLAVTVGYEFMDRFVSRIGGELFVSWSRCHTRTL